MSRTIRKLILHRNNHAHCAKAKDGRFKLSDYNYLKLPKPPVPEPVRFRIEYEEMGEKYRKVPYVFRNCEGDHEEAYRYEYYPAMVKKVRYEWNPDYDSDGADLHYMWEKVHHMVRRNGTCYRQRVHAAQHAKRRMRVAARRQGHRDMMRDLAEFEREHHEIVGVVE